MKTLNLIKWKKTVAGIFVLATFGVYSLAYAEANPIVTTTVHSGSHTNITSATVGTGLHASVALASTSGPTVLGSVNFSLYPNTTCSGTPTTENNILLATGSAESATTTVGSGGLSYKVHFNGQSGVYNIVDGDCVSVTATSQAVTLGTTLSTTTAYAGTSVYSSATLSGAASNATGTVTYTAYTDNSCSAGAVGMGTKTVTNATVPNSDSVAFNTVGTFYLKAVYSGDQNNNSATSPCKTLSITSVPTTPTPTPGTGTISGTVFNDLARNITKDSIDPGLSGWTIKLYSGNGWHKSGNPVVATAVSDANGNYSFNNLADGTYSIEQIIQSGWKQLSPDYQNVVISSSIKVITDKNFADATSTKIKKDKEDKKEKRQEKQEKRIEKLLKKFEKLNVKFGWGFHR